MDGEVVERHPRRKCRHEMGRGIPHNVNVGPARSNCRNGMLEDDDNDSEKACLRGKTGKDRLSEFAKSVAKIRTEQAWLDLCRFFLLLHADHFS